MATRPILRIALFVVPVVLIMGLAATLVLASPDYSQAQKTPWFRDSTDSQFSVQVVWEFGVPKKTIETSYVGYPAKFRDVGTDGRFVFATYDRTLFALDGLSGDLKKERTFGAEIEQMALRPDAVVVTAGQAVHALDPQTGKDRWSAVPHVGNLSRLVHDSHMVYASTLDGATVALDAAHGLESWRFVLPEDSRFQQPAAANGVFVLASRYFSSYVGTLIALDAMTGETLWTIDLGAVQLGDPVVGEGVVFVPVRPFNDRSVGSRLYAFSAKSGAILWSVEAGEHVHESPFVHEGGVFVATQVSSDEPDSPYSLILMSLDASSGTLRWTLSPEGWATPGGFNLVNGVLFINVYDVNFEHGTVYALDPGTGERHWNYQVGNGLTLAPAIVGNLVVVTGESESENTLLALGLFEPEQDIRSSRLGWDLLAWFISITAVGWLIDLFVRQSGGWKVQQRAKLLASRWTPVVCILVMALIIGLFFGGHAAGISVSLGALIVALTKVMVRVPSNRRRRHLAGLWLWVLMALLFSVDLTNDRLGPIALFDHPERMLVLVMLAAAGGFVLAGWSWPASIGISWLGAVILTALFISIRDGSARYLDAWRMLLTERWYSELLSPPSFKALGNIDLATYAIVGAGLMMAGGAVAWALGMPPPRQKRWIASSLFSTFIAAAAVGVLTDDALSWCIYVMLVAGLAIGIIVRRKRAFALTIGFGFTVSIGAAAGILLARGLVHAWQAPSCDWLTPCTSSEIAGGMIGMVIVSLIPALVGIGIGQAFSPSSYE